MKYKIDTTTINSIFGNYLWQTDNNDLYSYNPNIETKHIVRILDYNNMPEDGSWKYQICMLDDINPNIPLNEQFVEDSSIEMRGTFIHFGQTGIAAMTGLEIDEVPLIVAIVGESGSGKTVLSLELEKRGIPNLVSYTTRPMRPGETNGVEHHFVTEDEMPAREDMLAYTYFGGYHYWTAMSDIRNTQAVTYVIDEQGVCDLYDLKKEGKIDVLWVSVTRENNPTDEERVRRDECRQKAREELKRRHLEPHAIIENKYSSVEEFLEKEGDALYNYIKFITATN